MENGERRGIWIVYLIGGEKKMFVLRWDDWNGQAEGKLLRPIFLATCVPI